jgi:hypothetical protein
MAHTPKSEIPGIGYQALQYVHRVYVIKHSSTSKLQYYNFKI